MALDSKSGSRKINQHIELGPGDRDLTTTGDITAGAFYGDGSNLTGIITAGANDALITISAGGGLTGGGGFTVDQAADATITVSHSDTSSQASVANTAFNVIQSITLDTYGHITAIESQDIGTAGFYVKTTGEVGTGVKIGLGSLTYQTLQFFAGAGLSVVRTDNEIQFSAPNAANWNTAYGWGDHSLASYTKFNTARFTGDLNTIGVSTLSSGIYNIGTGYTNGPSGDLYGTLLSFWNEDISVQMWPTYNGDFYWRKSVGTSFVGSTWRTIWDTSHFTATNISNWDTAYSWGDHASAGYLTTIPQPINGDWWNGGFVSIGADGVMEMGKYMDFHTSDSGGSADYDLRVTVSPGVFSVGGQINATGGNSSNWNTAYGWGNHASAGYLTSVTNVSGYSGELYSKDLRTISPSSHGAYRATFGFTSWANNGGAPYADYLHLRSYSDSSGGSDNLITFLKNGIGMRIWQQAWGSSTAYSSYVDVITSGNIGSQSVNYATSAGSANSVAWSNVSSIPSLWYQSGSWLADFGSYSFVRENGVTMSGGSEFVLLSRSGQGHVLIDGSYWAGESGGFYSLNNSNQYTSQVGFSRDGDAFASFNTTVKAANDVRAPIFYDSNNTGYYVDPASYSTINGLYIVGQLRNNSSVGEDDSFGLFWDSGGSTAYAIYREEGAWSSPYPDLRIAFHTGIKLGANSGYNGIRFYTDYDMATQVMSVNNGSDGYGAGHVYVNNIMHAGGSHRAPIFYDSNDTAYYIDPNNSSRIFRLNVSENQVNAANNAGGRVRISSFTNGASEMNNDSYNIVLGPYSTRAGTGYYAGIAINGLMNYGGGTGYDVAPHIWIGAQYRDTPGSERSDFVIGVKSGTGISGTGVDIPQERFRVDYNGIATATGSLRAPIFYDSNDTNYYVNPDSSSNVWNISAAAYRGNANVGGTGTASWHPDGIYCGSTMWQYGSQYKNDTGIYDLGEIKFTNAPYIQKYNTRNLIIRSHDNTDCGILGRGSSGQFAFQVYGDGGGSYGFLGYEWGDWDIRKVPDGRMFLNNNNDYYLQTNDNSYVYRMISAADARAPIFYDQNDTGYYIDPNGTSNLAGLTVANQISGSVSGGSNYVVSTGYGNGTFTWRQSADTFGPYSGWHNYLISNHGDGSNYYNTIIAMPFWGVPRYSRLEGGTQKGPYTFWSDENMDAPNKSGTSYYQTNTWMQLNGGYGLYWPNNYGAHFYPNDYNTYTQFRLNGSKNGYGGIVDSYSGVAGIMYDSAGNGGMYRESPGRWYLYHHVGNNCTSINTSTGSSAYGLYVDKGIYSTGDITAYSDVRKKTNIATIDSALDKVTKLRGVYYDRIDDLERGRQIGVIAQEVNEVLPEAVTYAEDIDEYGVKYGNIVGVLIEAIKEQQKQIEELKAIVDGLTK